MARTPNERQDDTDLRVAVGVIQSQMKRVEDSLGRVETKMDNNAYVHESRYAEDRKEDAKNYATKEEIKPIKNMFYAVLTAVIIALVSAVVAFALKGGLA
jgi:hypothetical protein